MTSGSAYSMVDDRERCLTAGMDSYVSKPIRTEELIRDIYACLQQPSPCLTSTLSAKRCEPAVEMTVSGPS